MIIIEVLGYLAGILIVISMLPQVIKNLKEKSTRDISLVRSIFYVVGVVLFILYSFLIKNYVIIIMNSLGFCLGTISLFSKIFYR